LKDSTVPLWCSNPQAPVDSRKRKFSEDGEAVPSPATPPEALELSELSERSTERAAEPAAKRPRRPRWGNFRGFPPKSQVNVFFSH
jgi:hypothetical protein